MIHVTFVPDKRTMTFEKLHIVLQLLEKLDLRVNDALIVRGGELLTPDRRLEDGDHITVRPVISRG